MLTVNTLNVKKKKNYFRELFGSDFFSSKGIFSGEGGKHSKLAQTVLFI